MNLEFSLTTPALLFPAISLLMLAYTNRFVVLADLIRNLHDTNTKNPSEVTSAQIDNLRYRMNIIKKMQVFGASSFVLAASSMLASGINWHEIAWMLFILSLVLLITSLLLLLKELSVSIDALMIQLDDIKEDH